MATQHLTSALEWHQLLQNQAALYKSPTAHHRELLHQAYALRDAHVVDATTLAEMLELADAALDRARDIQGHRLGDREDFSCTLEL
ncbi:hypothetical protein D0O09_30665 [Pseudomonas putida]|nr:hypothetical protein D0O09_30665 [Pseudomonas putida]